MSDIMFFDGFKSPASRLNAGRWLGIGGRRVVDGELRSLSSNERHEAGLRRLEEAGRGKQVAGRRMVGGW